MGNSQLALSSNYTYKSMTKINNNGKHSILIYTSIEKNVNRQYRGLLTEAPNVTFVCEYSVLNAFQSQPFDGHLKQASTSLRTDYTHLRGQGRKQTYRDQRKYLKSI